MTAMARLATVLLLTLACADPTGPGTPEPIQPLPWFEQWYEQAVTCAGGSTDFADVEWYGVPGVTDPEGWGWAEWEAPHVVRVPIYWTFEPYQSLAVSVYEGGLRDALQTNDVPGSVRTSCPGPE